jgi:3-phenylpropionate/trans-cinnamate dioxygenase ferredoxin reductase subunit
LNEQDIVFAAGAPDMVRAVARIAKTAGAKCYTDPFEASAHITTSDFWSRAAAWLSKDAPPSRRGNRGGQAEIQAALNAPS